MSKLKQYPASGKVSRVGIKVSWSVYPSEADAKQASEIAKHNARILADQGYDFGYQSPGSVKKLSDGEYAGWYEVCLP